MDNANILHRLNKYSCVSDMPTMAYARYKEYGSIFRLWIGGLPLVLVAEGKYAEVSI